MTDEQVATAQANMINSLQAQVRKLQKENEQLRFNAQEIVLYLDRKEPNINGALRRARMSVAE